MVAMYIVGKSMEYLEPVLERNAICNMYICATVTHPRVLPTYIPVPRADQFRGMKGL